MRALLVLLIALPLLAQKTVITPNPGDPLVIPLVGGPPTGAAGGDLAGSYPNPTIKASVSLTTPVLNVATATTINLVTITQPATAATVTLANNSTLQTTGAFTMNLTCGAACTPTFPSGTHSLAPLDTPVFTTNITTPIVKPPSDSTTAFQITKTDGTTRVIDVDTTNARVGINKTPGAFDLDVNGAVNFGSTVTAGGTFDNSGNASADINAGRNFNGGQFQSNTGIFSCGSSFLGCAVATTKQYAWSSTSAASGTIDTTLCRQAAGIVEVGSSTGCAATGSLLLAGVITSGGTKFTVSGCSAGTTVGGATAGKFTLGANTCTVVITMNGATGLTAPNGWVCNASDQTAPTILIPQSASNTTTCSLSIPAGAGATDVITFSAVGYD